MKKIHLFVLALLWAAVSFAQTSNQKIGVLYINTVAYNAQQPNQLGNIVRRELVKFGTYNVLDISDVRDVIEKNANKLEVCYGAPCVAEIGKSIGADLMVTGVVETFEQKIIITLRLVDTKTASVVKASLKEFILLPSMMESMMRITLQDLFGAAPDPQLNDKIKYINDWERDISEQTSQRMRADGPRIGAALLTGQAGMIYQAPRLNGGFNGAPYLTTFGYQFEVQYFHQGRLQALFEIIPLIMGLEQSQVIPSLTLLNGLRDNKTGWEFAFGLTINANKHARGYYSSTGEWHLENDWNTIRDGANPYPIETRMDSRGQLVPTVGLVLAAGKTTRIGALYLPINAYVVPNRDGLRVGMSFGFNARRAKNTPSKSVYRYN